MRHFFFSDADGKIIGHGKSYEGWAPGCDPSDPDTVCPLGRTLHQQQMVEGGATDVAHFDCACPNIPVGMDDSSCDASCLDACHTQRVVGGALVAKPTVTVFVDGTPHSITPRTPIEVNLPPGVAVDLRMEGAVPDGHEVTLIRGDAALALADITLTFTAGVSNTVQITPPAQGARGVLYWSDSQVVDGWLYVTGWA